MRTGSYHLFRVGKIWHYRFQLDGQRIQRSTGKLLRHLAEPIAERAYRDARLWSKGAQLVPTLRELVALWLTVHAPTASPAHLKIVETFGRLHLHGLGDLTIDALTTDRVEEARNIHLKAHSQASTNQWLKVLRLLCNWAVKRRAIPAMPFNVKILKVQKRPRQILSVNLALQWLDAVDTHEGARSGVRTAVRLMLGLGLREIETITARWEWLDWARETYTPGVTKGREADALPIPQWLLEYLRPLRQPAGLIVTKRHGDPFTSGFTRRAMLAANQAVNAGHITAHRLRGTFATLLTESGAPVQAVQRALRHKSVLTTIGYLEVDMDSVSRAQARIAAQIGFSAQADLSGEQMANAAPQTIDASSLHDYRESS